MNGHRSGGGGRGSGGGGGVSAGGEHGSGGGGPSRASPGDAHPAGTSARERMLERVRRAAERRMAAPHPGALEPGEPEEPRAGVEAEEPVAAQGARKSRAGVEREEAGPRRRHDDAGLFAARFREAGGQVEIFSGAAEATRWLEEWAGAFSGTATAADLPASLRPDLPELPPTRAGLGVSLAVAAAADTGSLLLDSAGGRALQLLPETHLVWVPRDRIVRSLQEALESELPGQASTLALHSGPSKSADMGGELVRGVHGPGRVVAAILPALP